MTVERVINWQKWYIVSFAKISWKRKSIFFACKWSKDNVYFNSRKEVSRLLRERTNPGHSDSLRIVNQIHRPPEVEVLDRLYVCQCLR